MADAASGSAPGSLVAPRARATVLHVPYTYFPDASGGTEVYVRALAKQLGQRGYPSAIAAPGRSSTDYVDQGLEVYRFATDASASRELAYGAPDMIAAEGFRDIMARVRPAIVNLHARTASVSNRLVEIAHAAGARVVFTYHTPTVSCARGTMMLFGEQPCDGVIDRQRCSACLLGSHGVPRHAARLVALLPDRLARQAATLRTIAKPMGAFEIPAFVGQGHRRFHELMAGVDHVVAVCRWVEQILLRNGVPAEKITLCRQGLAQLPRQPLAAPARPPRAHDRTLKLAYFGRIDPTKGLHVLSRALRLIPCADVSLDIYGVRDAGRNPVVEELEARAREDPRLRLHPPVPSDAVVATMAAYDLVAIPSVWLETGPLVALEAFAAGCPVLGSRLGGIAELVRDGVDGVLLPPNEPAAWAKAIADLAEKRQAIDELRRNIREPRTMAEAARDMADLYAKLLDTDRRPGGFRSGRDG